jgi:hypothetical protein
MAKTRPIHQTKRYHVEIHCQDGVVVRETVHAKTIGGARVAALHAGMRAAATHGGNPKKVLLSVDE